MSKDILSAAIELAAKSHAGQTDEGGKPYILHCLRVMKEIMFRSGFYSPYKSNEEHDYELYAIAVLNDTAKYTGLTIDMVRFMFGDRVANGVDALTKRKDESNDDYLSRVKANPDAVKVKIEALRHNMDISRLPAAKCKSERDSIYERHDRYADMMVALGGNPLD